MHMLCTYAAARLFHGMRIEAFDSNGCACVQVSVDSCVLVYLGYLGIIHEIMRATSSST